MGEGAGPAGRSHPATSQRAAFGSRRRRRRGCAHVKADPSDAGRFFKQQPTRRCQTSGKRRSRTIAFHATRCPKAKRSVRDACASRGCTGTHRDGPPALFPAPPTRRVLPLWHGTKRRRLGAPRSRLLPGRLRPTHLTTFALQQRNQAADRLLMEQIDEIQSWLDDLK